ncbi:MAG: DUF1579 family protein [Acidobacteria bacterium]|nr:DUF1579 family protein [Acidobacteriota bacterium]
MRMLAVLSLVALSGSAGSGLAQESKTAAPQVDMAEMMKKARVYIEPGPAHKVLERFLGSWDTEMRFTMPGLPSKPEKGTSTCSWLMPGRWMKCDATGTMMGKPLQTFVVLGYDNFKMSYRVMTVSSMDTAMFVSEGDLDPNGKVLITYGTLDEYLTGEHDKMVRYVWRFLSDDRIVLEVHDLPIGETNTKVLEFVYTRRKP